jgi:hypothetical protein
MSTTALERITAAFQLLNVFQVGATIPAAHQTVGFTTLNNMLKGWSLETLMAPVTSREVFPIIAGKGGPDTPYTIGPGGDLDTTRPPFGRSIDGAGLLLTTSSPPVEIQRAVYSDDEWGGIAIKDLASGLFTGLYYSATSPLGSVFLWPVPNVTLNSLVIYRAQPLTEFVSLTANYDLPDGMEETIDYNLARRLKTPYGKTMDADAIQMAEQFLSRWKVAQVEMDDLSVDPMWIGSNPRGGYNIDEGNSA